MYIRQNILEENLLKNLSISIFWGNRILEGFTWENKFM